MGRPTVHDIAREAGVSLATVDRVLNARPGVRETTVARVKAAVDRLGYVRDTFAANLARRRQYCFAFVLPAGPSQFADMLRAAVREASASPLADRIVTKILSTPAQDPHAIVRTLQGLDGRRLDGVAIMAQETPQVRDAVARLRAMGLRVVTLVSDLPNAPRDHFIGINNIAAGRTAGALMGRFVSAPGEAMVVTNGLRSRDSLERRLGFDAVLAERFTHIRALPTVESNDDPERMRRIVVDVLRARPGVRGVYAMGAGNTPMLESLRASGRLGGLTVITHELTPVTRQGLLDDEIAAVITQNVGHLARSALRVLRALCDGAEIIESQERIRLEIVMRENLH